MDYKPLVKAVFCFLFYGNQELFTYITAVKILLITDNFWLFWMFFFLAILPLAKFPIRPVSLLSEAIPSYLLLGAVQLTLLWFLLAQNEHTEGISLLIMFTFFKKHTLKSFTWWHQVGKMISNICIVKFVLIDMLNQSRFDETLTFHTLL